MAGVANVVISIAAQTAGAVRDINAVNQALGDQVSAGSKASSALKKAAVPAAAAFAVASAAVVDFTKAAAEDADAQASLAASLKRTTGATQAQIDASEKYITKLSSATGVADDDLRPALEKLAAATGSVTKGQQEMQLAVDIAAASHKDLAVATKAVVAADAGRLGALQKLVPGIDAATIKSKDQTKALQEAADLTHGAALDAAQTYGGQMKVMSNQVHEAEESIGAAFLPALQDLLPVLKKATDFVSDHTHAASILLAAILAVSGAIVGINAVLKLYEAAQVVVKGATAAWTAAQWLLNAALDANPIGVIVLAIVGAAGLVVAIKLAYDHCKTFRDLVDDTWSVLKAGITIALAPLILEFRAYMAVIDQVRALMASPIATKLLSSIGDALQAVLDVAKPLLSTLGKLAAITFDALVQSVKDLVSWISKIKLPSLPSWVKDLPGSPFGRAGAPPPALAAGARGFGAPRAVSGSSGGLTINVFGAVDPEGTARAIRRLLDSHDRRQGRIQ